MASKHSRSGELYPTRRGTNTVRSGAENKSTGAQYRTRNGYSTANWRQNSSDLTTQHARSHWGDKCGIWVLCIWFTLNGWRINISRQRHLVILVGRRFQ